MAGRRESRRDHGEDSTTWIRSAVVGDFDLYNIGGKGIYEIFDRIEDKFFIMILGHIYVDRAPLIPVVDKPFPTTVCKWILCRAGEAPTSVAAEKNREPIFKKDSAEGNET